MRKYEDDELQKKYDTEYLVLRKKAKEAKDDNSIS